MRRGGPEVLAGHPNRTLLLCWPPYGSPLAAACLRAYRGAGLAFIGEGEGGCTGDPLFHRALRRSWRPVQRVAIPTWPGLHDALTIYQRVGGSSAR